MTVKKLLLLIALFGVLFIGISNLLSSNFFSSVSLPFNFFKSESNNINFVIPNFEDSQNSVFYQHHFEGLNGYFVLTRDHLLELFSSPSFDLPLGIKLNKGTRVRVMYQKSEIDYIDGVARRWLFICDEVGEKHLGWVFKDQLIFKNEFKPAKQLEFEGFSYDRGHYSAKVTKIKDNLFNMNWKAKGNGFLLRGDVSGQFLEAGDILWLNKDDQDFIYDFFLKKSSIELKQEWYFNNDSITMNMYVVPE